MSKFLPFVVDLNDHYYQNDKSFHIVGDRVYGPGAFLNSKPSNYCFRNNLPELIGGTRELRKVFFDKTPVKQISEKEEERFKNLVEKISESKKHNPTNNITTFENDIDQLVYHFYNLTEEETRTVEDASAKI